MEYVYLLLAICASASLSIMSSLFGKRNPTANNSSLLYSVFVTGAAVGTWAVFCICLREFNLQVIGYSIIYGTFYTIAMIGMFKAYQTGSVSITAFIKQLSLIFVALWGLFFWGNQITINIVIGEILIVIALYFCFMIKQKRADTAPISLKWLFYASMLLVGNAGCSIVQKYQTIAFGNSYGNIFMFFGVLISFIFCILLYFRKNRCKISDISKNTVIFPIIGGISSGLLNLFILLLICSKMSESVFFPGIAIGGLILTILFSTIVYREKPTKFQWIGLVIGGIALIFLNI